MKSIILAVIFSISAFAQCGKMVLNPTTGKFDCVGLNAGTITITCTGQAIQSINGASRTCVNTGIPASTTTTASGSPVTAAFVAGNAMDTFLVVLGANTVSTLTTPLNGEMLSWRICQQPSGGSYVYTMAPPTGIASLAAIRGIAGACANYSYTWNGTSNVGILISTSVSDVNGNPVGSPGFFVPNGSGGFLTLGAPATSGTLTVEQGCTAPDLLQNIGGTTVCVSPFILTSGAAPPQNGVNTCPVTTQKCVYIDITDSKGPISWYRLPGAGSWTLESQQSGFPKSSLFVNFPNANLWPAGTTWFIPDCLDANCNSGGGSFLGAFTNISSTSWSLQGVIGTTTGGNGSLCATSVAKSATMHFIQTCPFEIFYVPMNGSTQSTVDWTCSAGVSCEKKEYMALQDSTGFRSLTLPSTDHGGMNYALSAANTAAMQTCSITSNATDFNCYTGTINILSSAVGGTMTITNTVTGIIGNNMVGFSYDKVEMIKNWCPFCASGRSSQASKLKQLFTTLVSATGGSTGAILRMGGDGNDGTQYSSATAEHTAHTGGCLHSTPCLIGNADITDFANFVCGLPSGWKVTYGLNYYQNNGALIASEATFINGLIGSSGSVCTNRLMAFEIGNEPDHVGSPSTFVAQWKALATTVAAAVPSVPFVGPSLATTPQIPSWDGAFWADTGVQALMSGGFISQHYYRIGVSGTIAQMLTQDVSQPPTAIPQLEAYAAANGNIPMFINETASVANGGQSGVSNSNASASYMLDQTYQFATLAGTTTGNYYATNWIACPGADTGVGTINSQGCYTSGYTPIWDTPSGVNAQPGFYAMLMADRVGSGNLISTTCSVGGVNETCYTVKSGGGVFHSLIDNKDLTQNSQLTVTYPSAVTTASYELMSYGDPTAPSGVSIQGAFMANTGFYTVTNTTQPPAATALTVPGGSSTTLTVFIPAHSAIHLIAQ